MNQIKPAYAGEAMLLRWGDTHSSGRTITIQLDEHVGEQHPFKGLRCGPNGQRMQICAVLVDENEQPQSHQQPSSRVSGPNENGPEAGLTTSAIPIAAVNAQDKPRTPFKDLPRSQQAALKCQDTDFMGWLARVHKELWRSCAKHNGQLAEVANFTVKEILNLQSKKELDTPGPKAEAWDKLLTDFEMRAYAR